MTFKNVGKETERMCGFSKEPKLKVIRHCNACSKQPVCIYMSQIEEMCKVLENAYSIQDVPEGTILPYIGCYYYENEYDR